MKRNIIGISLFIAVLLFACKSSDKPDISDVKLNMNFHRFDRDFYNCRLDYLNEDLAKLSASYGEFYKLFSYKIVGAGNFASEKHNETMKKFLTHFSMNYLMENVEKQFNDDKQLQSDIEKAFSYFNHYFPEVQLPDIYMFMGGMNQSIVVADSILGIALEKYLGTNWEGYSRFGINKYLRDNMYAEKIPSDCIRGWALTEFEFNDSVNNLLSNIIYQGMIQHVIDKCLPDYPDSVKYGYTNNQLKWCENNEDNMWNYLIEEKLLFSTDQILINKFVRAAPFTNMFTHESPGRAVVFLGYRIIEEYMERNPNLTLNDLMKKKDYQQILQDSKYMP